MDIQRGNIMLWLAVSIIFLSTGLLSHVMALPIILNVAGRDAWIAVLIAAPFFMLWFIIYTRLIQTMNGVPFIDWTRKHWGLIPSWFIKLLFAFILFFNGMYTLLDTMMWTLSTYLQQTPITVVTLCAIISCVFIAIAGLQSIGIIAAILFPIVALLGYFVKLANGKHKDYELLFPVFDHGYSPAILGSVYVLSSLMDTWIIVLFAHKVKKKISWKQAVFFTLFLLSLVIGPLTGSIMEFGIIEATKQRYPAFEQWKILSLGLFLQHVDFLSIYQWLAGSIIRISISLYLLIDMFNVKNNRNRAIAISIVALIMLVIMYFPWREEVMLNILQRYYFPSIIIFVTTLTALIGLTAFIIRNKEATQDE